MFNEYEGYYALNTEFEASMRALLVLEAHTDRALSA